MTKQSHSFFENKECEYYPCHKDTHEINCLFCYCPAYTDPQCPGVKAGFGTILNNGVKDCSSCTLPHRPHNFRVFSQWNHRKGKDVY